MIPLHRVFTTGQELGFMEEAIKTGKLSGNGKFTELCQHFFQEKYGFKKCLLTQSCTAAIELAALLLDIQKGDEVIVPSYTYVSSANPFVLRGAEIVFADSKESNPNLDPTKLKELITKRTKAIVVVHYAGISSDMETIMQIANKHNVYVIEDAAHGVNAYWNDKPLGGIGHFGTYSFHATKNITSGEGGMLMINDERFIERADILCSKGTNRKDFLAGKVDKYQWCDIGSSYYPSELTAAFLWAQLQDLEKIINKRILRWNIYFEELNNLSDAEIPFVPDYARHNAHLFYLKIKTKDKRDKLLNDLKAKGIMAAFHFGALHQSLFFKDKSSGKLVHAIEWQNQILRLPLYYDLSENEQEYVIQSVKELV